MPGIKISDLNQTLELRTTDFLALARPGLGNGTTHKIPGSIFAKKTEIDDLQSQINDLDLRVTDLENRMTAAEARILLLEGRSTNNEGEIADSQDRIAALEALVNQLLNRKEWSGYTCPP